MWDTSIALLLKFLSACTRSSAEPGQKELNLGMEKSGSLHSKGKSCFLEQVEEALRRLQNDVELIQNNLSASLVSPIRSSTVSQFSPFTPHISLSWRKASSAYDTLRHQAL